MTVCIAALYDDGAGVVLASDQMVTAHIPIGYEFEHGDKTKIIELVGNGSVYALIAGDVLRGNEVINVARTQLIQREGEATASEVAAIVRSAYQQVRLTNVIHVELEPRGLDLGAYYNSHQKMSPQLVQMIDHALSSTNLGVEMLIAGANGRTHTIHTILNPGVTRDHSSIGLGAIGSGAPHALYSLIEDSCESGMDRDSVVGLVKKAKNRSEVAPGVGKETTIIVIPSEDTDNAQPETETPQD